MIVIMIYLGVLPILQTKDPVSIKLFFNGVIIFLIAFLLWNIGKYYTVIRHMKHLNFSIPDPYRLTDYESFYF